MLAIHPGDHAGLGYCDPARLMVIATAFAHRALDAQAQVMVFPPVGGVSACTDEFETDPRLAAAWRDGHLHVLDSRAVQLAGGAFDAAALYQMYAAATATAVRGGFRGLWVAVDMGWAIDVNPAELAGFEAGAHPLFATGELTAVCLYDTGRFGAARATSACAAHPITEGTGLRHRWCGPALCLSGETDMSNSGAWRALLGAVRPGGRIDLGGMGFVDVSGLRAVAERVERDPSITVSAGPEIARLLAFVDVACAPRVEAARSGA